MNKWQLSAVIYATPHIKGSPPHRVMNFTVYWTDVVYQRDGTPTTGRVQQIDCTYRNPPDDVIKSFQAKEQVFLLGRPYVRVSERNDESIAYVQAMEVHRGEKWDPERHNALGDHKQWEQRLDELRRSKSHRR